MTDYNFYPPVRFWFEGDTDAAKRQIPRARHLLTHMIRQMEAGGVESMDWHYREEGVYYELHKFGDSHIALIRVEPEESQPSAQGEPETKPVEEPKQTLITELVTRILTGHVYLDANWSKEEDEGDSPLANVTVKLTDEAETEYTTETDDDGNFQFMFEAEGAKMGPPMAMKLQFERGETLLQSYQITEGEDPYEFDLEPAIAREDWEPGEGRRIEYSLQDLGNFGFAPLTGYLWCGVRLEPVPYSASEWGEDKSQWGGTLKTNDTSTKTETIYNGASRNLTRMTGDLGTDYSGSFGGVISTRTNATVTETGRYASGPSIGMSLTEPAKVDGISKVTGITPMDARSPNGGGYGDDGKLAYDAEANTLTWQAPNSFEGAPITLSDSGRYELLDGDNNLLIVDVDTDALPSSNKTDDAITVEAGQSVGSSSGYSSTGYVDNTPNQDIDNAMFTRRQTLPAGFVESGKEYRFTRSTNTRAILWPQGSTVYQAVPGPGNFQFETTEGIYHVSGTTIAPSHVCLPDPVNAGTWMYYPASMTVTPREPPPPTTEYLFVTQVMDVEEEFRLYSGGPFVYRKDKAPDCQAFAVVDPNDPAKSAADLAPPPATISGITPLDYSFPTFTGSSTSSGGIRKRCAKAEGGINGGEGTPPQPDPGVDNMVKSYHQYIYWYFQPILLPEGVTALQGTDLEGFYGEDTRFNEEAFITTSGTSKEGVASAMTGAVIADKGHQHPGGIRPGLYRLEINISLPGGTKYE